MQCLIPSFPMWYLPNYSRCIISFWVDHYLFLGVAVYFPSRGGAFPSFFVDKSRGGDKTKLCSEASALSMLLFPSTEGGGAWCGRLYNQGSSK